MDSRGQEEGEMEGEGRSAVSVLGDMRGEDGPRDNEAEDNRSPENEQPDEGEGVEGGEMQPGELPPDAAEGEAPQEPGAPGSPDEEEPHD